MGIANEFKDDGIHLNKLKFLEYLFYKLYVGIGLNFKKTCYRTKPNVKLCMTLLLSQEFLNQQTFITV